MTSVSSRAPWVAALLVVRFGTELMLLSAVAVVGAITGQHWVQSVLFAVIGPLLVATAWGLLVAPRAPRRLREPGRLALEVLLFVGAGVALAAVGQGAFAVVLVILAVPCALLVRRFATGS